MNEVALLHRAQALERPVPRIKYWDKIKNSIVVPPPTSPSHDSILLEEGTANRFRDSFTTTFRSPENEAKRSIDYKLPRIAEVILGIHVHANYALSRPSLRFNGLRCGFETELDIGEFVPCEGTGNRHWIWKSRAPIPMVFIMYHFLRVSICSETLLMRCVSELGKHNQNGVRDQDPWLRSILPEPLRFHVETFWLRENYWRNNMEFILDSAVVTDLDPILISRGFILHKSRLKNEKDESSQQDVASSQDWSQHLFPNEDQIVYNDYNMPARKN